MEVQADTRGGRSVTDSRWVDAFIALGLAMAIEVILLVSITLAIVWGTAA